MRVYTHPACLLHDPGPGHPESPSRLAAVTGALRHAFPALDWQEAPLATRAQVARVHVASLIERVLDTPVDEAIRLDADTVLSLHSAEAALRACGAGVAAVDALQAGAADMVFCAVRPPGHHATSDTAMGFCLFNAIAVAAEHALAHHGLQRVAILDFDVHHGNGTQAIFEQEPRVLYLSSHQSPLYPLTGLESESGVGNIVNATLAPRAGSEAFRAAWSGKLLPALQAFSPQMLLVSAGFDAHRLDPLADLQLEAGDYQWLGEQIALQARRHAGGQVACVLEGGYSLTALRECSVALVLGLQAGAAGTA